MTTLANDEQRAARLRQSIEFDRVAPAMSLAQIADAMNCSRQAVDQLLQRGLAKARKAARAKGLEAAWIEALRAIDQTGPSAAAPTINTRRD
jgi:DNA-directed RNA polymerase sigma subunit (sigma70/sigma32)